MAFRRHIALAALALPLLAGCAGSNVLTPPAPANQAAAGKTIFRTDTFGDEAFWTGTLHMNTVVQGVPANTALAVGLKVDADALPPSLIQAIQAGQVDLTSPSTTVALLKLNAVVGVQATVDANNNVTNFGVTCALCHSTVDDRITKGIGSRLDGWPNRDLNPGAIIALSPALTAAQKSVYNSWGAGRYDPRYNFDGINGPVPIPPAYGLAGVALATYTGDGDIEYWNRYVAVTQMHGLGSFSDARIGVNVTNGSTDLVGPVLDALRDYELSLAKPAPPAAPDPAAATRGQALFAGAARCSSCHSGAAFSDGLLHAPSETGMDPAYANRSATKKYRTTPLRGLARNAPYFHDGSAPTLAAVVSHYNTALSLGLTAQQQSDLAAYLQTL